ncbi:hypothetical protein [Sphingomonas mollis]|uniref:Uncharacterized protein n=1 Tax=Sphingomonas mollis TaxID=2795726 RepID=A0ABS0XRH8_9SPHN|nr:hypothetical protein [Sphingomonas sp. BT553]MBJ6122626.1 hypothetical protein [Sphingomonas sp. BT553]
MIARHRTHIINLRRDARVHTNATDVEVHDIQQLLHLIAALRALDAVNAVERV